MWRKKSKGLPDVLSPKQNCGSAGLVKWVWGGVGEQVPVQEFTGPACPEASLMWKDDEFT